MEVCDLNKFLCQEGLFLEFLFLSRLLLVVVAPQNDDDDVDVVDGDELLLFFDMVDVVTDDVSPSS